MIQNMQKTDLATEWQLLQNQFDSYEKLSLVIKLISISFVFFAYMLASNKVIIIILLLVLWFQDAIWKTFQSRIEERLLELESALDNSQDSNTTPYQFNRSFLNKRPSHLGLIKAYIKQSLRPTVAFPYAILIVLIIASTAMNL